MHIASKGHEVASEAIVASKRPQGTDLTSELSSVTLITYVSMLLWPLNVSCDSIFPEGGDLPSIDLRGFASGKKFVYSDTFSVSQHYHCKRGGL